MARIGYCALSCHEDIDIGWRLQCIVVSLHAHDNVCDRVMMVKVGRLSEERGCLFRGGWRLVYCVRWVRVLPVVPRIGVKGHQAGDLRGFTSPGSAWDGGKQERIFY